MQFTLKCLAFIYICSFVVLKIYATYTIPDVKIEALRPEGLRVSLPDEEGIQFYEFHANINENIDEKDLGNIFIRVTVPEHGQWRFIDKSVKLNLGDVVNYWLLVWNNGEKYTKHGLSFKIEEYFD